ncbi:hypothetical protein MPSEU_000085500 [Mayamaea pseudoterrestris]|nr:hypothetical protein MPSEU_000085500 [Mayamaea pseudoterrestris]
MASIPRLSEAGAAQLMELLVARGLFKQDGHESIVLKTNAGHYATMPHLRAQLLFGSSNSPARLVDATNAALELDISMVDIRPILSSLSSANEISVYSVTPSQPAFEYDVDLPKLLVNDYLLEQAITKETSRLLGSTEKASRLSDFVAHVLAIPDHKAPHSSIRADAIDLLSCIIRDKFMLNPMLTNVKCQHGTLIISADFMATAQFSLDLKNALAKLKEPTLLADVLSWIDTSPTIYPDLNWVIDKLGAEHFNGLISHNSSHQKNQSGQYIFVPNSYLAIVKDQVLSVFASHGLWSRIFLMEEAKPLDLSLITPQTWLQEAHPNAVMLPHAVVRADITETVQEAIKEAEYWLDVQAFVPDGLSQSDMTVYLNDHLVRDESTGIAVASSNNSLFVSCKMLEEIREVLMPSIVRDFVKTRAREILSGEISNSTKEEGNKDDKRRKGKDRLVGAVEMQPDAAASDVLPLENVVDAILSNYNSLDDYVHELGEENERRELVSEVCRKLYYRVDAMENVCHALKNEILQLEQLHTTQQPFRVAGKDSLLAFEDQACFATACYMIQLMASFVEYYESTIDKDDLTEQASLEAMRQDFLQSLCADFARRLTMYSLQKHGVLDDVSFFVQHGGENLSDYCSPIGITVCAFPKCRIAYAGTTAEEVQDDPLKMLREALDASAGKSVTRMWTLLGSETCGRGYKAGDLKGFLSHIKDECLTMCGLPFKIMDKKAKKQLLNDRRQGLIRLLQIETGAKRVLDLAVMHLWQHFKNQVAFGELLCGPILQRLVHERKMTGEMSSALLELAASIESGCISESDQIERVKTLSLGKC